MAFDDCDEYIGHPLFPIPMEPDLSHSISPRAGLCLKTIATMLDARAFAEVTVKP